MVEMKEKRGLLAGVGLNRAERLADDLAWLGCVSREEKRERGV